MTDPIRKICPCFGEIFGSIFGRNDKRQNDRDRGTSQNNTSVESAYSNTSVGGNSSHTVNGQSDKTIYYCEYYPNLSIGKSITKEPNAASLQSKHEVSQSSSSSSKLPQSSTKQTPSSPAPQAPTSFAESSSFPKPQSSSFKPPLFSTGAPPSSSTSSSSFTKPARPPFTWDQPQFFSKGTSSSYDLSQSSSGPSISSLKAPPPSKLTLSALPTDSRNQHMKANYKFVQKTSSPIYMIPKDIEDLIKKDIVPDVLNKPLSPSTYKDYFAALLYAEDFYIEKWREFQLSNVTLTLHKASIYEKSSKKKKLIESDEKQDKVFAALEMDSAPERRPFLMSRDFVYARPIGRKAQQFQGLIYRVSESNSVIVEFEEEFYSQHHPGRKYDISFSFNRVCLKRAHQAIAAASDPSFPNYLFPDCTSRKNTPASASLFYINFKLDVDQNSAVRRILSFQGSPPYLVEGPLSVTQAKSLSGTGMVVREAVLQIYHSSLKTRILICAHLNSTCDVLTRSLKEVIPESDMFRANAAFRELDGVPVDILPLCLYKGECFSCPSLEKLRQFRVIFSTFSSSFRLHNEGITAGHFSHIFLVDASSVTEPETMIALGNLAKKNTSVIVTGAPRNHSGLVRSDIARMHGLRISYFERLRENKTYKSMEPMFITKLYSC